MKSIYGWNTFKNHLKPFLMCELANDFDSDKKVTPLVPPTVGNVRNSNEYKRKMTFQPSSVISRRSDRKKEELKFVLKRLSRQ